MSATGRYDEGIYGESLYASSHISGSGGGITMAVTVYRTDYAGNKLEELGPGIVSDGGVDLNLDRAIRLSATFATRHPERIAPYHDILAPEMTLSYDDGREAQTWPMGLYTVRIPPGTWAPGRHTFTDAHAEEGHFVTYEGEDLTRLLADSSYTAVDNVPTGTNIIKEIEQTIDEVSPLLKTRFEPSSRVTGYNRSYPVGTSRLEKINLLFAAIGYYEITMDLDGYLWSDPIRDVTAVEPFATWGTADFVRPIEDQPIDTSIANVVIVVRDNPGTAPLKAVRRNTKAGSPTSTVSLGREKARIEKRSDLDTQADVNALADRLLAESRSYYQTARTVTLPNPAGLIPHQTVDIVTDGEMEPLSGRWWVRTARMGFSPRSAALECDVNRLTDSINGVPI